MTGIAVPEDIAHKLERDILQSIDSALSEMRMRCPEVDPDLTAVLERARCAFALSARKYNAASRQIPKVPIELWNMAWAFLPLRDRIAVSHVCRQWRDMALSCPNLWSDIDFDNWEHDPNCSCHQCRPAKARSMRDTCIECGIRGKLPQTDNSALEALISRTSASPLTLRMAVHGPSHDIRTFKQTVAVLVPHASRIRSIELRTADNLVPGVLLQSLQTLVGLESLTVHGSLAERTIDSDPFPDALVLPKLRYLEFRGGVDLLSSASTSRLRFPALQVLSCTIPTIQKMISALTAVPTVQEVRLTMEAGIHSPLSPVERDELSAAMAHLVSQHLLKFSLWRIAAYNLEDFTTLFNSAPSAIPKKLSFGVVMEDDDWDPYDWENESPPLFSLFSTITRPDGLSFLEEDDVYTVQLRNSAQGTSYSVHFPDAGYRLLRDLWHNVVDLNSLVNVIVPLDHWSWFFKRRDRGQLELHGVTSLMLSVSSSYTAWFDHVEDFDRFGNLVKLPALQNIYVVSAEGPTSKFMLRPFVEEMLPRLLGKRRLRTFLCYRIVLCDDAGDMMVDSTAVMLLSQYVDQVELHCPHDALL